jgi:hypothetical protein
MIHVKTDEIYGKNDIINVNDQRKHIVNIDSRFRDSTLEPPTNFIYRFARPYKNVIRVRVATVEIPNGFYTFSRAKKNTMFRLDATDYQGNPHFLTVEIPEGDYTPECLIQSIQEQLNAVKDNYGLFFRIRYDPVSRKTTIIHDGSAAPPCPPGPTHCPVTFGLTFMMVGQEERHYDFGLGSHLGFNKPFYVIESPYELQSESLVNTNGDNYLLLGIDDHYTVEQKTSETYIQCLAKILVKRSAQGIIFDDGYTVLSNDITFPRPQDLKQVRIRLMDPYGVPLELHNLNMSLSLEITSVMNLQLYESYRNYVWDKSKQSHLFQDQSQGPRAMTHISGSSSGIAPPALNYP